MMTTAASSDLVLSELAAWCELAHNALRETMRSITPTPAAALKSRLLRQHARHLRQLRNLIRSRCTRLSGGRPRTGVWSELVNAMRATDEHVVLAACSLLERAVLAAYERAARFLRGESTARLIRRHMRELQRCLGQFLGRLHGRPAASSTSVPRAPVVNLPAGPMLASA